MSFSVCIHQRYSSKSSFNNVFLALSLRPISYQFGRLCSFLVFAWVWERLTFNLIFKFSKNSSVKPSGLGLSFFERFSSIDSICFLVTGLFRCSVSPLWSRGGLYLYLVLVVCMLQEFIHFPLGYPVCWCIFVWYSCGSLFCFGFVFLNFLSFIVRLNFWQCYSSFQMSNLILVGFSKDFALLYFIFF